MISYIRGTYTERLEDGIVVETGGMGYHIHVPFSVLEGMPKFGEEVRIFTSLQVREDSMTLFGFLTRQDLSMFRQLLGVNGIGPKAALGILSTLTLQDLRYAIISGDAKAISKAPGIGAKTAQKVILELKDRMKAEDLLPAQGEALGTSDLGTVGLEGLAKEATEALVALGYSTTEAVKAVRQVEISEGMTVEGVLKTSLKYLAF